MSDDDKCNDAGKSTVLVVDNDILVRMAISAYLRDCGFHVIEAMNADEALTVLGQADIIVNIVLSDIDMISGCNGFSLAKWVRKNKPGIPVILASSPARAANAAADLCESGPLLAKPYEPRLLVDRIRQSLAVLKPLSD